MFKRMGDGPAKVKDLAVDFGDTEIYIGGKTYPKGYFANAALNMNRNTMTDLLKTAAPAFDALQDMKQHGYDPEAFAAARDAVAELKEKLFVLLPFCLLDLKAERARLNLIFSTETMQLLNRYWELIKRKSAEETDLAAGLTAEETECIDEGTSLLKQLMETISFYVYLPMDFAHFRNAVLTFERDKLRNMKIRDEHHFASASGQFFSDRELWLSLLTAQVTTAVSGFTLEPVVGQEFVVLRVPGEKNKKIIARRLHFGRMMDFLVTDFFEGLHAGHAPKRCAVCGRYFLTTDARPRKYCSGYAPNDPRGRTCQAVAARRGRKEREKADDHPVKVICERRCNTIDHHLRDGKIDREFADTAKRLARKKKNQAIRDNPYFKT